VKRLGAFAALLLCLGLIAGCGSSSSSDSGSASESAFGGTSQQPEVVVEASSPGFDATRVYNEASPGVVTIRSVFSSTSAAEGSGFVLDKNGEIVTNAHVVTDDSSGEREPAKEVFVEFPDHNVVDAEIVGFDPFADVALLQVEPDGFALHPMQLGNDHDLRVGQPVAAIGSPFGEQQSLSVGVVSATDRSVQSLTQFEISGAIQTDASINPGNSGGPLLDAAARVLGINEQIETNSGSNSGVGFAVPVSAIKRSIAQLEANGEAEYAYIGVSTQTVYPQLADKLGLDTDHGSLLSDVVPDSPADKAGLEGGDKRLTFQAIPYETGGDVIVAVDGHPVVAPNDLLHYIAIHRPGQTIQLEILRDGERKQINVTLGKRPQG
jgi:S1-C subfamily serine protease